MEERTIDEARGALSGRLAALASRLHQGPLAAAEYCRAFCEVLVENSRTIPGAENSPALLTTYKEAISAFTKILPSLSDDCPQVSAVLARLVLCCFELLLYLPASDLPVGVWDAFTLSIEESQATLEQLGHDELRVVVDVVRAGGAWRTPAMLSILHKESVPPEKVDASLLSEGPVMLRLRLSSLVAVGRHVEACHLAECCANLSELGSASATFKLAHLGLVCDTASSDDDLQSEAAHIDGSEALDLVCNLEAAGHAHGARLLCTALLKRKLRNVEKNSTWEIIMLWSQLTRRAWPSESSRFISACLELGSVARTTCHLLFLIRTIQAEVPSDGLEACVQLCIRGLRLQAEDGCESATEEHVSAMVSLCLTLACLMPDDAEVGRACLLTHFFEDISVITYRALEQASSNSEAKPTCSSSLPPSMRCELLLLLKARWPFDPELWDWTSLRQQCLNMLPSEETAKLVPAEGDSVKEEQTSPGVEEHEEEEDKEKKDRSGVKMLSDDGRISWREALAATNLMPGYTINAQHQHNQGGTGLAALKQDMQKSLIDRPQIPSLRTKHRCRLCRRDVGSVRIVRHARKHFVTGQPGCPLCPKRFSNIEEATWHVRLHLRRARKAALSRTAHEKQTKSSRMIHRLVERPRKNPQDKDWTPALAVPLHRESDASSESEPSSSSGSPQLARPSLHRKVKKNQLYGSDFVTFSDDGTSDVDDSSDAFFPHNGSRRERINGTNLTATEVLVDYFGPTIGCDGYLRRHPCPSLQCDKAFKMFKTLVAHVRTVHAMNANVQLAMDALQAGRRRCCRYCRRKFGSTVHLHDHLFISHSGPAPYGCPQMDCSLRFESNEELVRHSASHLKYCGQCAFPGCGEIFGRKQLLYRHEASHYEVHVPGETSEGTETSSPPSPQRPRGRPSLRGHPPSTRGRMRSLTNTTRTPKTSTVQMRTSLKLQKPLKKLFCGIDSCFSTFNWPQSLHRHLETMHGRQGLPLVRSRHIVPEELRGLPTSSLSHSIMDSIKNPPKPTLPAQNADISTILKNPSPHIERSESQRQPRGRRGRGRGRPNKVREPTTGCKHDWEAQWPAIMQDGKFVCTHCSMVYESGKPLGGRITTKRKAEGPLEHLCLTKNKPSKTPIFVKSIKREKGASLPYALQNTTSSGDTKVDITANRPKVEIVERIEDKAGDTTPEIRHASDERIVGDCVAPFSKEKVTLEIDEAIKEPDKTSSRACVERSFINDVPQVPFSQPILPCQRFETKPFTKMLAFDTPSQHSTQLDQPEWKCSSSSGSYGPHRDTNAHTTHIPTTEPYHASLNTNTEPPPHTYEPNFGKPVQTLFSSSEPPITSYDGLGSNLNHPAQSPHVVSTQDPPRSSSYPYCAPSYSNSVTNTHLPLQSVSFQYQQSQSMQKATANNSDSCNKDPSNSIHTKCTESGTLPLSYPNESLAEHSSSFAADLQADGTSCESNIFGEISVSEILETVRQMDLENSEAHGEDDDRDGVDWTSSDNPYNSLYWGTGSDSNDDSHCNLGMDDLFGAFSEAHEDASGTDSKYNEETSTPRKRKSARHRKRATDVNMKVLIRPFICHLEGCKYNALTRSALVNHYMKTHGYSREGVSNLNHCKSSFTPFHCFLSPCTKAFTRNSNLRSHYRSVHRITGEELDKLCSESLKSIATNLSSPIKQEVISHVSCAVKQESPTRNLPAYGQKDLGELTSEDTSQTNTQLLPSSFCMIGRQSGPVDQVAPSVATDTDCKGQIHPPSHPSFSSQISSLSPFGNQDDLANPNLPDSVQSELSKVRLQAAGKSSEAECSTSCENPPALNAESRAQMMQIMQKGKMPATSIKLENDDVSQLNGNTCEKATRPYMCNMTKCRKYFVNFTKLIDHYRDYHNLSSDEVQHYIAPDDADEFREHLNSLGSFTCYSNLSRHEHAEGFGSVESPQKQSPPGFQVISNAAACLSGESSVPQPVENSFTPMPTSEDNSNVPSPATIFAEPAVKNDLSKPVQTGLRGASPCLGAAVNSKNKRLTKKNKGWPAHLSKASTAEQPTSQSMKYLCGMENCTGAFHTSATLRRHMRRKHDHAVAKTHPKPIIQLVRGESGEWIDLCNGTTVIDGNTEVDELPPSILKSSEDTLEICKCSHLNSKHACMLISCSGVLSSSYSLIRHYRRVHRMPAAYIDMHLSRLVINRQRSDQKRHRASADASPSSAKPVDRDRVQNWRRNYDFKVGSKMNRNHAHASSVDCNPVFNSLLNPDPTLASHFDLGIIPDSPLHQGTAPASTLETEAASAYPLKPEDACTSTLHPGAVPTSTLYPGAVAVSTLNPSLTPTSTLEPGVVPTSEFEPNIAPTSTLEPGIASTSMLEPDVVATSVLEKDAAPASTLETDDVPVSPLQQDAAPDSSLENEMALPSLLECRSRQQSTFMSHHQHNSMLGNNEKHTSLSRGPALASLLKSNHTFVSPVNKRQELSSSHPLQTLPTSVNHIPKYANTNQLPHDHNCSLATTMLPSQSSPSHLCHGQALARHLCPGRASAAQLYRGRASAGQMGRGRGSAGQMGRGSAGHMGRGRGSAGHMGRGRGLAGPHGPWPWLRRSDGPRPWLGRPRWAAVVARQARLAAAVAVAQQARLPVARQAIQAAAVPRQTSCAGAERQQASCQSADPRRASFAAAAQIPARCAVAAPLPTRCTAATHLPASYSADFLRARYSVHITNLAQHVLAQKSDFLLLSLTHQICQTTTTFIPLLSTELLPHRFLQASLAHRHRLQAAIPLCRLFQPETPPCQL
uniref:C2H2-type domain-containing protein n=3 Tax=Eptatretus burgeri TaxID=7764 RepID=A0A8C4RAH0_EPTBU